MITKLTIKNVARYTEQQVLETNSRINLAYGLNGTGKSTLVGYIQSLNEETDGVENKENEGKKFNYCDCSVEGFDSNNQKILVYNKKFVKEYFYETDVQKGIFTINKGNKEAKDAIAKAESEKANIENILNNPSNGLISKGEELQEKLDNEQDVVKNKLWKIKTKHTGGDRVFDEVGFFTGLKIKDNLFQHILNRDLVVDVKEIIAIRKELQELMSGDSERDLLPILSSDGFQQIENDGIFQEIIIGNKDTVASNLITELQNSDWVKKGLDEYVDLKQRDSCPFCQQNTLTKELVNKISDYFDKSYDNKLTTLEKFYKNYQELEDVINGNNYQKVFFTDEHKLRVDKIYTHLKNLLSENVNKIKQKIDNPSKGIQLKSSLPVFDELNEFITNRNYEIKLFNKKLQDKAKTIQGLENDFWDIQRKDYDQIISDFKSEKNRIIQEQVENTKVIQQHNQCIIKLKGIIQDNQKKVVNVDETIEAINNHLIGFGIDDFHIVKYENTEYRITRGGEASNYPIFNSLSEGEKTVISFLYFIELCNGREDGDDIREKIVVIDDPVSSLSHMYVFNIAQLIRKNFLFPLNTSNNTNVTQCFVFTHSLYFFTELYWGKINCTLFRISKSVSSFIESMEKDEIQNEYQSYWQVIKDEKYENTPLIANAMRNIIEHFFGFIDGEKNLSRILMNSGLDESKFAPFNRYINRESHSDASNISDYKEFDYTIFKEAFIQIFVSSGYKNHYEMMMGENTQ